MPERLIRAGAGVLIRPRPSTRRRGGGTPLPRRSGAYAAARLRVAESRVSGGGGSGLSVRPWSRLSLAGVSWPVWSTSLLLRVGRLGVRPSRS